MCPLAQLNLLMPKMAEHQTKEGLEFLYMLSRGLAFDTKFVGKQMENKGSLSAVTASYLCGPACTLQDIMETGCYKILLTGQKFLFLPVLEHRTVVVEEVWEA